MLSTLGKLLNCLRRMRDDENGAATTDGFLAMVGIVIGVAIAWSIMDQRFDLFAGRIVASLEQAISGATISTAPIIDGSGANG
jgi:hypothetical protein